MSTAETSKNFWGEQPFQIKAREALPLLVRQALMGETIFYSDLAQELSMPNPRNLNHVLGSVGTTLIELSEKHDFTIPAIQCVVVNKATELPGEGVGWFLSEDDFQKLSSKKKKTLVDTVLAEIYTYSKWLEILELLKLEPPYFPSLPKISRVGGGEGEEHKVLKQFVAKNPILFGLPKTCPVGEVEYLLPSGDSVDVMFSWRGQLVAVEVKSKISAVSDIFRGLFQCVKYQAVSEAILGLQGKPQNVRAVLAVEGRFPAELMTTKHMLGIEVVSEIEMS